MSQVTLATLFLSLSILTIGSFGGMAITWKLAGAVKGYNFLYFGLIVQFSIFFLQIVAFYRARTELLSHIRFLATFSLTMAWVLYCLVFPVFWVDSIGVGVKLTTIGILIVTALSNFLHAINYFKKQWVRFGLNEFNRLFNPAHKSVDWNKVVQSMNINHAIYFPGLKENFTTAFSVFLFAMMLIGLSLRAAFPIFSVFAWGVPMAIVASFFLQVGGNYFCQALVVRSIEKEMKIKIRSCCNL